MNPFIIQQNEIRNVLRLITPQQIFDYTKIRVGNPHDGGYVMINDFDSYIKKAISFGIGGDDSWDIAIANRGIAVEQYDHTIEKAPTDHPYCHFHKERATVDTLIRQTQEEAPNSVLFKMDIDGDEWDLLDTAQPQELSRFTQMVIEFHYMVELADNGPFFQRASRIFNKLYDQFAVVHVHGNNFGNLMKVVNISVPETIELTFANRKRYKTAFNIQTFPQSGLDYPNNPHGPDIWLGTFQF